MNQEMITYIISLVPAITAILTAIATMIGVFVKIKQLTQISNDETKKNAAKINAVLHENAEIKKEMKRVLRKIYKVKDDDKEK